MVERPIWFSIFLNRLFAKPVLALLAALHIQPANPAYPIPTHVAMEVLAFLIAAIFFLWLRARISVDRPGGTQQCMEALLTNSMGVGVRDLLEDNIGHDANKYVAMLGSIGIFVLLNNLSQPGPDPRITDGPSLRPARLRNRRLPLLQLDRHRETRPARPRQTFPRPGCCAMSPIMLPIEIVSNLARLLSLTVRLWVNMLVSETLYVLFLGLMLELSIFLEHLNKAGYIGLVIPLIGPIPFILLHIFVAVLQAFVFTILPVIYVAGAVAEEH